MDASLGLIGLGDGVADFLVLAVVQGQRYRVGGHGGGGAKHQGKNRNGQAAQQGVIAEHHAGVSSLAATYLETMISDIASQVPL
ncbi:hypothetical protein D3C72_2145030 [compost metagenome]